METYLFALFVTELVIWIAAYVISGNSLVSPTVVTCTVFMAATLCIIYNIDFWNVHYTFNAYFVTSLGLLAMLAGETLALILAKRFGQGGGDTGIGEKRGVQAPKTIEIPRAITFVLVGLDIVCTAYVVYAVMKNGSSAAGLSAIGETKYSEDGGLTGIGRLSYRYTWLLFIVYTFVFFKNSAFGNKRTERRHLSYLAPLLLVCVSSFFMGNRANFLKIICTCCVFWVLTRGFAGTGKKLKLRKVLGRMLPAFAILLIVFYLTREITKVGSTTGTRTFIDYITYYIGSPLYLFSSYLDNPYSVHMPSSYFGELTFEGFYNFLGIETTGQAYTLVGGQSGFAGNVYSWLCRPYNDFGLIGSLIFTAVVYAIFAYVLYGPLARRENTDGRDCTAIVFSYFYYVVFFSFYYCQVCWAVTPTNLVYAFLLVAIYKIVRNKVLIFEDLKCTTPRNANFKREH